LFATLQGYTLAFRIALIIAPEGTILQLLTGCEVEGMSEQKVEEPIFAAEVAGFCRPIKRALSRNPKATKRAWIS